MSKRKRKIVNSATPKTPPPRKKKLVVAVGRAVWQQQISLLR